MAAGLERADALYDVGRYQQAAALLSTHLASEPGDAGALVRLARCHNRLGDRSTALAAVDEGLRADPGDLAGWIVRADVLLGLGRHAEAEQAARRAIEIAPNSWSGHLALGTVLDQAGGKRRREAYAAALRSVERGPEEDATHFLVGLTAQRLGDHATAQRAYETALRLNPESSEAHNNLSLLHMRRRWFRRGAWTRAAEGFVEAAALDLDDREARYNLETMAWGTAAGARWVALIGFFAAAAGSAPLRTGATGSAALIPELVGAAVLLGVWTAWALWMRRRVPPRLRRPLLLLARGCPPVLAMTAAVALLGLHSAITLAVPGLGAGIVAALGAPLFWGVVITYWASRAFMKRRAPRG